MESGMTCSADGEEFNQSKRHDVAFGVGGYNDASNSRGDEDAQLPLSFSFEFPLAFVSTSSQE